MQPRSSLSTLRKVFWGVRCAALSHSVLDARERHGASVSASGGSLEPNAWGWGPTRVKYVPREK